MKFHNDRVSWVFENKNGESLRFNDDELDFIIYALHELGHFESHPELFTFTEEDMAEVIRKKGLWTCTKCGETFEKEVESYAGALFKNEVFCFSCYEKERTEA